MLEFGNLPDFENAWIWKSPGLERNNLYKNTFKINKHWVGDGVCKSYTVCKHCSTLEDDRKGTQSLREWLKTKPLDFPGFTIRFCVIGRGSLFAPVVQNFKNPFPMVPNINLIPVPKHKSGSKKFGYINPVTKNPDINRFWGFPVYLNNYFTHWIITGIGWFIL